MKIKRHGAMANHGVTSINIDKAHIGWNDQENSIELTQRYVPNFNPGSEHHYTVLISLSDIRKIIEVLGEKGVVEKPELLAEELSPCLRQLLRLEQVCIGDMPVKKK